MFSRYSISAAVPRVLAAALALLLAALASLAQAQSPAASSAPSAASSDASSAPETAVTLFPHSDSSRGWISGQANIILQWHSPFPAAYSGPNSFGPRGQSATSKVYSLYTGFELTHDTEVFLDVESAGGHGLSEAFGLAGFTNLDVVRNPALGLTPYLARLMVRQIIPLSHQRVSADRDFLDLGTSLPVRRLEFRVGKFGLVDFLDNNSGGSDSHLQFLNWAVDDDGAYDYAANTRGYTDGALVEYDDHGWSVRFVEAMMPKIANGLNVDADLARSRSENLEIEYGGGFLHHREGAIRVLSYVNTADMGNYREAIEQFNAGEVKVPSIIATRREGRNKYGFELNPVSYTHLDVYKRQVPKRLRQLPGWSGVRRIALMENRKINLERFVAQVGVKFRQLPRRQQTFVNHHARGQRTKVRALWRQQFGALAH